MHIAGRLLKKLKRSTNPHETNTKKMFSAFREISWIVPLVCIEELNSFFRMLAGVGSLGYLDWSRQNSLPQLPFSRCLSLQNRKYAWSSNSNFDFRRNRL